VKQQEKNTRYEIRKAINNKKGNCRLTNQGLRPSNHLFASKAIEGSTASKTKLGRGQGRHKISARQIQSQRHSVISKISKRTRLSTCIIRSKGQLTRRLERNKGSPRAGSIDKLPVDGALTGTMLRASLRETSTPSAGGGFPASGSLASKVTVPTRTVDKFITTGSSD
jgi:hypothetical protein